LKQSDAYEEQTEEEEEKLVGLQGRGT